MSFLQLLRPTKRSLYEVLALLPNKGVGARVTRAAWAPYGDSYWEITKVRLKDDKHGDAWGVKVWKGRALNETPTRVRGGAKRLWQWMPTQEEVSRYQPIMEKLQAVHKASKAAAAAAAEGQQQAASGGSSGGSS